MGSKHHQNFDATVLPPELAAGIAKQKYASGEGIREYVRLSKVTRGQKKLKHLLPLEEHYEEDGTPINVRNTTITNRKDK